MAQEYFGRNTQFERQDINLQFHDTITAHNRNSNSKSTQNEGNIVPVD